MIEIPATVAFLQKNFSLCIHFLQALRRKPIKYLRVIGALDKLNLLNKIWLSPELSDSNKMIRLIKRMMLNNYPLVNMMFHSTSLKAGLSPFVLTKDDEKRFLQHIKDVIIFTRINNIEPITLSEASQLI